MLVCGRDSARVEQRVTTRAVVCGQKAYALGRDEMAVDVNMGALKGRRTEAGCGTGRPQRYAALQNVAPHELQERSRSSAPASTAIAAAPAAGKTRVSPVARAAWAPQLAQVQACRRM